MNLVIDDAPLQAEANSAAKDACRRIIAKYFQMGTWNEKTGAGYLFIEDAIATYVKSEAFKEMLESVIDTETKPTIEAVVRGVVAREVKKCMKDIKTHNGSQA